LIEKIKRDDNHEIIAVCSQIYTKHIYSLCGQDVHVQLLNVKMVVHTVTTEIQSNVPW